MPLGLISFLHPLKQIHTTCDKKSYLNSLLFLFWSPSCHMQSASPSWDYLVQMWVLSLLGTEIQHASDSGQSLQSRDLWQEASKGQMQREQNHTKIHCCGFNAWLVHIYAQHHNCNFLTGTHVVSATKSATLRNTKLNNAFRFAVMKSLHHDMIKGNICKDRCAGYLAAYSVMLKLYGQDKQASIKMNVVNHFVVWERLFPTATLQLQNMMVDSFQQRRRIQILRLISPRRCHSRHSWDVMCLCVPYCKMTSPHKNILLCSFAVQNRQSETVFAWEWTFNSILELCRNTHSSTHLSSTT